MTAGLLAAKIALGPLLLPQASWLRRKAVRLPEAAGPREGVVGDGNPVLRLLVVGDSSAAGVGLARQTQALALPLAARLHERLGVAVVWQLVAQSGVNTQEAVALLDRAELAPADVVVTALGVNDVSSQISAARFTLLTAQLWSLLKERTGARWAVLSGLPPMGLLTAVPQPLRWYLGRYATWLDAAAHQWAEEQCMGFCSLRWTSDPTLLSHDGFHPGELVYPQWADRLTDIIVSGRESWAVGR
ncbi:MAG: SGNH/GDSL hydrolase family protein [Ramlibacter sp.]